MQRPVDLPAVVVPYKQELFWNTRDPEKLPLREQEYYELSIEDSTDPFNPGIVLRETRHFWDAEDGQLWGEGTEERCASLRIAENRYKRRRQALAERGYNYSDMDPLF